MNQVSSKGRSRAVPDNHEERILSSGTGEFNPVLSQVAVQAGWNPVPCSRLTLLFGPFSIDSHSWRSMQIEKNLEVKGKMKTTVGARRVPVSICFRGMILATVVFFVGLCCAPARAQGSAAVSGKVADPSGLSVVGAKIQAVNVNTNLVYTGESNEVGLYNIPNLPPGIYRITAQKEGFVQNVRSSVELHVADAIAINFALEVGSVTQSVTVEGNPEIVETEQSNSSNLVNEQQIVGLPLNGRNPAMLVFLTGGTSNPVENNNVSTTQGSSILQGTLVFPTEIAPTVHGVRGGSVYFSLDGANNMDTYEMTGGPFPNPDATTEFSVVSGIIGAQYVSAPGGAVNIVTKSGTNKIHGDVFEFVRNGFFNARNFFSSTPDELKRNQFGGTLGGPIKHDKWFIFGSYQGTRLANDQGGNVAFVPSVAERSGNFSQILPQVIKNPATGLPFPGNIIPTGAQDPVVQAALAYIPSAAAPLGAQVIPGAANDRVNFVQPIFQTYEEYTVKSDYVLGNHHIFGRYFDTQFTWAPNGIPNGDLLAAVRPQSSTWSNVTAGDTWAKGNFVSNLRFTYVRDNSVTGASEHSVSLPSLGANYTLGQFPTIQTLAVTGGFSITSGNFNGFPRHTIDVSEDVNFFHGRHQVSFGAVVQHTSVLLQTDNGQNGGATSTGVFSGNAFADFILGRIPSFKQSDGIYIAASGTLPGFYGEDRIRATSRLNITAGLRWDPYPPYTASGNRIECWQPGVQSNVFENAPTGLTYPGDPGCNSAGGVHTQFGNIEPRVGFAYKLDSAGKTAVHGGYGIYTSQFPVASFLAFGSIQPFLRTITNTNPGPISNPWLGFPGGNPFVNGFELNGNTRPGNTPFINQGTAYTFNTPFKLFYTQQWSLIFERALAKHDVINVSYFGTKGTRLSQIQDDNEAVYVPGTAGTGCAVGQYGTTAIGQPCSTQTNIQLRRPSPLIGSLYGEQSTGDSIYHGLEIEYHHQFHAGFTLSSAFTYSRAIDDTSSPANLELSGGSLLPLPGHNHLRRTQSDFNQQTTWRTSGVWDLPFGNNLTRVGAILAKGWELSGIFTRDAGLPINISTSNTDNSFSGLGLDLANVVPGVTRRVAISDFKAASQGLSIVNPLAFVVNTPGTVGISGRNAFDTPDYTNFDTGISKTFPLEARFQFQFRTEFFNALNHPQFYFPSATTLGTTAFGQLASAQNPRILQFSAKLIF